jgi:ArsR family transcriptional regulator, arsenate/arsenite/antimonite-responsive transcriptional repressor
MLTHVFEALSHPDRRRLLALLKREGEMHAGAIAEYFEFTKPTLSHHLKLLVIAGLLDREKRGQFVYYRINLSAFEETLGALINLFGSRERAKEGATDEEGDHDLPRSGRRGSGHVAGGLEPHA